MKKNAVDQELEKEIIRLSGKGYGRGKIANKLKIPVAHVRTLLEARGIYSPSADMRERNAQMAELYDTGASFDSIAKKYGLKVDTVKGLIRYAKRQGYKGCPPDPNFSLSTAYKEPERTETELVMKAQGELMSMRNQYEALLDSYRKMEAKYKEELAILARHIADLKRGAK